MGSSNNWSEGRDLADEAMGALDNASFHGTLEAADIGHAAKAIVLAILSLRVNSATERPELERVAA